MYYEHFGLQYPPFKITPDTRFFFPGGNRGLVLDALIYAIKHGEGIVKVVGEVGSGKTMLSRMLEERLTQADIEIVYLVNPHLSPDMILAAIAMELRIEMPADSGQLQIMHTLHQQLISRHEQGHRVVVFIEEAQAMQLDTLEEVRLLSNLETTRDKLLQIVLFGQPELDEHLAVPHIRQLRERITHSFYLKALCVNEIHEYLHFRMQAVGYRGPPVFSRSATMLLTKVSEGLMRRVNILADKALLAAYSEHTYQVSARHIRLAAHDSGLKHNGNRRSLPMVMMLFVLLLVLIGIIVWHSSLRVDLLALFNSSTLQITPTSFPPVHSADIDVPALPSAIEANDVVNDLLQQRLEATRHWLISARGNHYTIQLVQVPVYKRADLARFLAQSELEPLMPALYVFQVNIREQSLLVLTYNAFSDEASAKTALDTLPDILQRNRPFLRTIDSLRDLFIST